MLESVQVWSAWDSCLNDSEGCTFWKASYILCLWKSCSTHHPSLQEKKEKEMQRWEQRVRRKEWNGSRGVRGKKEKENSFNKAPLSFALKTHQPPLLSLSTNAHWSLEPNKTIRVLERKKKSYLWHDLMFWRQRMHFQCVGFQICVDE